MKKKLGFTLIEVLAAVVILGVLSSVAVVAVNKFRVNAVVKDYDAMEKSLVDATKNYIQEAGLVITTTPRRIPASDLVDKNFIKSLKDPMPGETDSGDRSDRLCNKDSYVEVTKTKENIGSQLMQYKYEVYLYCHGELVRHGTYH